MVMHYFFRGKTARDSDVASKPRQTCIQNSFKEWQISAFHKNVYSIVISAPPRESLPSILTQLISLALVLSHMNQT